MDKILTIASGLEKGTDSLLMLDELNYGLIQAEIAMAEAGLNEGVEFQIFRDTDFVDGISISINDRLLHFMRKPVFKYSKTSGL